MPIDLQIIQILYYFIESFVVKFPGSVFIKYPIICVYSAVVNSIFYDFMDINFNQAKYL